MIISIQQIPRKALSNRVIKNTIISHRKCWKATIPAMPPGVRGFLSLSLCPSMLTSCSGVLLLSNPELGFRAPSQMVSDVMINTVSCPAILAGRGFTQTVLVLLSLKKPN